MHLRQHLFLRDAPSALQIQKNSTRTQRGFYFTVLLYLAFLFKMGSFSRVVKPEYSSSA